MLPQSHHSESHYPTYLQNWPPKMAGKKVLKKIVRCLCGYPSSKIFCRNSSICHHFKMCFCVLHRNSRWPQNFLENDFSEKSPDGSAETLKVKNFIKISHRFKDKSIWRFTEKFKMDAKKKWRENDFWRKSPDNCADTFGVKNFIKISHPFQDKCIFEF